MNFDAVIFDMDGVLTQTASVHAAAWKRMFDAYLLVRSKRTGEAFREFTHGDYLAWVDGRPRYEGVKRFLASRGIQLPEGSLEDVPGTETACGLGNAKDQLFTRVLDEEGAEVFPSTLRLIEQLRASGILLGVASSSKNCALILRKAGMAHLFQTRVDGQGSAELGLRGKPEPDIFLAAARNLHVLPARAAIVEDAVSGVQAGRHGRFGLVLGIARHGNEEELRQAGADLVVRDLDEIKIDILDGWFRAVAPPGAPPAVSRKTP